MTVISGSERAALLKLVQRATETMKDQWIQDCIVSFGWEPQDATHIINNLRRMAKRELNESDKLEL
jgi:hypothetical protein